MGERKIIQVEDKVPFKLLVPLSIQHMFAMFGASVLVPFIFGINPAIVLFMNGVGTLIFMAVTKGKAPAYLGSSFAFLAPAGIVISKMGYEYALGGFVVVGFCGCILSFIIYKCGTKWVDVVLPPAAMGPVVALIGLELSGSAASNAGLLDASPDMKNVIVFLVTLGVTVFGNILFRGFLSVIPILIAVIAGYITALCCGILDFSQVISAPWFAIPNFQMAKFNLGAILMILPVLLVITSEHIGHQVVTGKIIGRGSVKRSGTSQISVWRQLLDYDLRLDRIRADHHIRREYWCHGGNKGVQCASHRRGSSSVDRLLSYRQAVHADPDHSGTGYRRNFLLVVRYDRNFRYSDPGGFQSGLQPFQKPDSDFGCICHRTFRNCSKLWRCSADRYGAGVCSCDDLKPDLLCAG